jgi:two-component system heavy metal sensor histidine kinase CusS
MDASSAWSRAGSIRTRMTLFVLVSSSLLFVAFAFFVRYAADAHFEESDNAELSGKLSLVRGIVDRIASGDDLPGAQSTLATALVGHPGVAVKVVGGDGTVLLSVANPPQRAIHGAPTLRTRSERLSHPLLGEVRTEVTLNSAYHRAFLDELLAILLAAVAVAVPMAAILGWLLAGQALRPIARLTRVAMAVTADNLQGRVDTGRVPAELQDLARAFDAMLGRLRDSFERLADYSVDLAHELRR